MKIIKAKDYEDMSRKAANIISAQVILKPDCVLGLATGSTPVGMYKELVQMFDEGRIDFSQVKTVNLDEYAGLPGDNDQSYRYFMNQNLFDHSTSYRLSTNIVCLPDVPSSRNGYYIQRLSLKFPPKAEDQAQLSASNEPYLYSRS